MSNHVGFPGDRTTYNLTVSKVVIRETDFGPIADHTLISPEGNVFLWQASTHAVWLTEGQAYTVKATIKTHETDGNGVKRTILLRVVQHFEPPRIPRMAVGLARHRR